MNKLIYCIFISMLCIFAFSCNSTEVKEFSSLENKLEVKDSSTVVLHSALSEKNIGSEFKIRGKLVESENGFILYENPRSRSKVTFVLEASNEIQVLLKEHVSEFITLKGTLIDVSSPWLKTLKVESIGA